MQLSVTFRHVEPSDTLKAYAEEKLEKIQRLLDAPLTAAVVLSVEKFRHVADVTLNADGFTVHSNEVTGDLYSAIDLSTDKIERQIKRRREKIRNRKGRPHAYRIDVVQLAPPAGELDPEAASQNEPRILETNRLVAAPMDVDEAARRLAESEEVFFVFTNARTDTINVIYRRGDGHFGLFEPYSS